jgi:5-methylcytosine-specific restriction protein A
MKRLSSEAIRRKVYARDHGICRRCGNRSLKWEADHIVPLGDHGTNALSNFQTLCLKCHNRKTRRENSDRNVTRRRYDRGRVGRIDG